MPRSMLRPLLAIPSVLLCLLMLACGSPSTVQANGVTASSPGGASTPGTTPPVNIPVPSGPGIFNVKLAPYSAMADGIHDDTLAIRSALQDACQAGGGEVYFPTGTYVISPQTSNDHAAITVDCDNITLAGSGMGNSVLSRKTLGDTDPDTTCPMLNEEVNRGYGIYVMRKSDGDEMRHSFHMQDLSLLGNRITFTGINGSNAWPATNNNCFNVWDISDKGILIDPSATDVQILRVEIAYFSGELFYSGGGTQSTNWVVSGSNLHHSNGDAISVTAGVEIVNNQLHDVATDGIEDEPFGTAQPQFISENNVYNVGLDGINLMLYDPSFYNNSSPNLEVGSNTVTNAHRYGVVMLSRAGNIHDNQIYDVGMPSMLGCGIAAIGMQASNGVWEIPQNINVQNNTIMAQTVTTQCGIEVYTAAEAGVTGKNISITSNTIGPMKAEGPKGVYMRSSIFLMEGTQNVNVQNNMLK
jgi:hypothetical protein